MACHLRELQMGVERTTGIVCKARPATIRSMVAQCLGLGRFLFRKPVSRAVAFPAAA